MAIEITGLPPHLLQGGGEGTKSNTAQGDTSQLPDKATAAADAVTLTTKATRLKSLEAGIGGQSVLDENRVEHLKAAIDAGKYEIDSERVAEKFIQFEVGLTA
jgi:negative regulator of flagellin synthesis FlgM